MLLGEHDEQAAHLIWERFFDRLCLYAKKKIYKRHQRLFDEGDIANQAFHSLFDGIKHKRFDKMQNRDDMWQMLTLIASRKIANEIQHHDRIKRGNGKVRGDSAFGSAGIENIRNLIACEPTPHDLNQFEKHCQDLLCQLPDDTYRKIALMRLAGHTDREIAEALKVTVRTIERKLQWIRMKWGGEEQN